MIARRLALLTLSAAPAVVAIAIDAPPSARRVAAAALVALIAPLFWPGSAATPARTARRIAVWSCASALVAAVAIFLVGGPAQPLARAAMVLAVLLLILLVTHAVAAALEGLMNARPGDPEAAREMAGPAAALALAILGAMPLWLGPAAELLAQGDERPIDALIAMSPLTHLALASGNDLLHNPWFYQHSNLARLRYAYPSLATVTAAYIAIAAMLWLVPLAARSLGRATRSTTPSHPTTEPGKS